MSFVGNPEQFKAHLATLRPLDYHDDPDDHPGWVVHPRDVVGREPVQWDKGFHETMGKYGDARSAPVRKVPVDQIRQTQTTINLSAVKHYVEHGPTTRDKYDPDGWYGTDHPVIVEHPEHGHVIVDGNSRFSAAAIRGDRELQAHVIPYRSQA